MPETIAYLQKLYLNTFSGGSDINNIALEDEHVSLVLLQPESSMSDLENLLQMKLVYVQ